MSKTRVIGIDPGATGGIAVYDVHTATVIGLWDMPFTQHTLTTKKKTKRVDGRKLKDILFLVKEEALAEGYECRAHIEKVQAFGKQSAPAAFNFGYAACWAEAICTCLEIEYTLIPPQSWKRQLGLIASEKDAARVFIIENMPYLREALKRKQDVDRADAVCLAVYKPRG